MSTTEVQIPPITQASGVFPSGINSSGPVQVPSILVESGLNASALIEGTIGRFLATVLAGSGLNSSAAVAGTSGLFQSGIDSSALIKTPSFVAVSVIVVSGAEIANSLVAISNIQQSAGPTNLGGSLLVQNAVNIGGLLTVSNNAVVSGTLSAGLSLAATSGVVSSGQIAGTSVVAQSGVNLSAVIQTTSVIVSAALVVGNAATTSIGGAVIFAGTPNTSGGLNVGTTLSVGGATTLSTVTVSALLSAGGSAIFTSGINLSQNIQGTVASLTGAQINGPASILGSAYLGSGAQMSALLSATDIRSSTLTVSALVSFGGSFIFAGPTSTTGDTGMQTLSTVGQTKLAALTVPGTTSLNGPAYFNQTISGGASLAVQSMTLLLGLLSVNASATFQSGFNASAVAQFTSVNLAATGFFPSGIVTSGTNQGVVGSFKNWTAIPIFNGGVWNSVGLPQQGFLWEAIPIGSGFTDFSFTIGRFQGLAANIQSAFASAMNVLLNANYFSGYLANAYLQVQGTVNFQGAQAATGNVLLILDVNDGSGELSGSLFSVLVDSGGNANNFLGISSGFATSLQAIGFTSVRVRTGLAQSYAASIVIGMGKAILYLATSA